MTFEKLSKIMIKELGTDKLSDIALEFKVSPQVVSNWKSRDQVPYKYVKLLREKLSQKNQNINFEDSSIRNDLELNRFNSSEEEDDILEIVLNVISLIKSNYKTIIVILIAFIT